jgi:hypothetical protein
MSSENTVYQNGWTDDFENQSSLDTALFPIHWGNSDEYSFGSNGLTLTSDGTAAGFMTSDQGAGNSSGYGLYQATFTMPVNQASGAYICLWPSTNVWPGPEIDLTEQYNGQSYLTVHWEGSGDSNQSQSYVFASDLSKPTTVGVNWQANSLTFYVNGQEVVQYKSGGSVPIPKDYADGGENESFGVGNVGPKGTSVTVSSMSYSPTGEDPVIVPSKLISVSNPGMQFVANPSLGATVPITISDPGLKDVYAFVMNSHNVAESNWIEIPLNAAGSATYNFHFQHSGDYVLAVSNPTSPTDQGYSGHISIAHS